MVPKRVDELLDGGSLFWVIKGEVLCRERILGIGPFTDKDGIGRCRIVLDGKVKLVQPRPYRAFQGWRYLPPKDAPPTSTAPRPAPANARADAARTARTWAYCSAWLLRSRFKPDGQQAE